MDTSSSWFTYLTETRQLSPDVIKEAKLGEELKRLRIPIFDTYGEEMFAKLRRPPNSDVGPKYLYEKGSSASLYGHSFTDLGGPIYWMEGELEVLAMRTMGLMACSGTGGAMTFKPEWLNYFHNREHIILFDNDETGFKGALKLAMQMKVGTFCWVPPMYGKDVGDLIVTMGPTKAKKILTDPTRNVSFNISGPRISDKRQQKAMLGKQAQALPQCLGKQFLLELAFLLQQEIKPKKPKRQHPNVTNAVEHAKQYPIEHLVQFTRRKAKCLWHEEKTPSLHLYPDNHLFCHGSCDRAYDAIDVYQKLHGCSFMQAVEDLNKL